MLLRVSLCLLVVPFLAELSRCAEHAGIDFNREIRPILSDKCFRCHGPDATSREADLRLDVRELAFEDRGGYRVIVPGDPEASELIRRVTQEDPSLHMPPAESKLAMSESEIVRLRRWIAAGAPWKEHWAFLAPSRPPRPDVSDPDWPRNAIDYFVLARLDQDGLAPSPEADRETLIRRVTLDLTGLPPAIEEIDAFLADASHDAYERLVDRLLQSPHYGEHMARLWLDAARYADTNGYQYDTERTQWPWRNWVIRAYNRNQSFDQFTIEQLGGDLLPDATIDQQIATGFNRNHGITIEGGIIDEEYRTEYVIDRVVTTSTVWMGLTMVCARCHDHKYDPFTQRDFYGLFAFFNQVPERGNSGFDPRVRVPDAILDRLRDEIAELDRCLDEAEPQIASAQMQWEASVTQGGALPAGWMIAVPSRVTAQSGATLKLLEDQSTLAGGDAPGQEVYDAVLSTQRTGITAIRLEALTHESLPENGPGRAFNSNFVLSEFEATITPESGSEPPRALKFTSAVADYSQKNFEIAKAIDGDTGTGWAVDGPTRKQSCTAVFTTDQPFGFGGGTEIRVRLRHLYGTAHAIGRFRFALSTTPGIGLVDDVSGLVGIPASARTPEQKVRLRQHFLKTQAPEEFRRLWTRRSELLGEAERREKTRVMTMVMQDMPQPRTTHVLQRGQYDKPQEAVSAHVPSLFPPLPSDAAADRLALARWLVDPAHPLTARVAVNRYWQKYFGIGLVKTAEDFGSQGQPPSHPELLDWLASEFVRTGWDVKAMQRLIVTSATYRQSGVVTPALQSRDPENRLLARGPRARLQAEMVRDQALAISGLLVDEIGGPSVYPYHPAGLWLEINNRPGYSRAYEQGHGRDLYRRSMYTFWKRTVPPPSMQTFDAPEREFCVVRRSTTNTPLQAFVLLHDPQFVEAARSLAERMLRHGGDTRDRLVYGFRLATSRRPSEAEVAVLERVFEARRSLYCEDHEAAQQLLAVGEATHDESLDLIEHAAYTAVARILLNLNETITKG